MDTNLKSTAEWASGAANVFETEIEKLPPSSRDAASRTLNELASFFPITAVSCTLASDGTDRGQGWFANGSSELAASQETFKADIAAEQAQAAKSGSVFIG